MWFECQLAKRKKISMSALLDALVKHFESRPPIGRIALNCRKLTMKQLFHVLAEQAEHGETFGKVAVRLGYLTHPEVAELLLVQADSAKPVGESLIEAGAISPDAYDRELAKFRDSQALGVSNVEPQDIQPASTQSTSKAKADERKKSKSAAKSKPDGKKTALLDAAAKS